MLYPVYIHKDKGSAYGMTFPDFHGCFSAADYMEDIPRMAQEAVEVHFDGEDFEIPAPSSMEEWIDDDRFQGGYWMLVQIDTEKIKNRPVRINISLPEYLVRRIDAYAKFHHMTRSGFLAKAAEDMMDSQIPAAH